MSILSSDVMSLRIRHNDNREDILTFSLKLRNEKWYHVSAEVRLINDLCVVMLCSSVIEEICP